MKTERVRLVRLLRTTTLAVAISACEGGSVFGPPIEGDIAEQRATWTARSIEDYDLTLLYSTMWVTSMKSVVEVRNGEVVRCFDPGSGMPRGTSDIWLCPSVDDLFDNAEEKLASPDGWTVTLRYDEKLGLIRSMYADVPGWADEEYWYSILNFQRR